ncbi:MAG: hypothetical protein HRU29_01430 [Rhizobiales bacterium]|nr:hypothetical protein [Hyphomicrobiales bacterium]NRB13035.1 hypothetical protein [Hyphomicrobiales bacterium]
MQISPLTAAYAMSVQGQTQQIMSASLMKAALASELAVADMVQQATDMVKTRQAPPPAGMGANVDKMA